MNQQLWGCNEFQPHDHLLREIRSCRQCEAHLPLPPRPVLNFHPASQLLIVGQAPGTRVNDTGIPWNDPSGDRLREWLQLDRDAFYNVQRISIVPVGFCYPGRGRSGDLPPRVECASLWRTKIHSCLPKLKLILLIGQYAQALYLGDTRKATLTNTVKAWQEYTPLYFPLPHPSPRNNLWLRKNPWFEGELLPPLRTAIGSLCDDSHRH